MLERLDFKNNHLIKIISCVPNRKILLINSLHNHVHFLQRSSKYQRVSCHYIQLLHKRKCSRSMRLFGKTLNSCRLHPFSCNWSHSFIILDGPVQQRLSLAHMSTGLILSVFRAHRTFDRTICISLERNSFLNYNQILNTCIFKHSN